jgi:hypothetical protein
MASACPLRSHQALRSSRPWGGALISGAQPCLEGWYPCSPGGPCVCEHRVSGRWGKHEPSKRYRIPRKWDNCAPGDRPGRLG